MADTLIQGTTIIEDKRSEKGEVWSCSGIDFKTELNTNMARDDDFGFVKATATVLFTKGVELPQGVTVTKVVVYSNVTDETWSLVRINQDGTTAQILATGNMDTEVTSISFATIDNENFYYYLKTSTLDTNDRVNGARIKYEF